MVIYYYEIAFIISFILSTVYVYIQRKHFDVNINENGEVDVEAFLEIIAKIQEENDSEEEILEAFKIFDKNKTNLITPKNVLDVFSKIDESIKEEEILQMFKECDLDKDGYLNYSEFSRMIKNK